MSMRLYALFICLLVVFAAATPAWAYLDPGTGSYLFQLLIGLLAGTLMTVKIYWHKIRSFFTRDKNAKSNDESEQ